VDEYMSQGDQDREGGTVPARQAWHPPALTRLGANATAAGGSALSDGDGDAEGSI
jgi:hypothetical protein